MNMSKSIKLAVLLIIMLSSLISTMLYANENVVNGLRELTEEDWIKIDNTPRMTLKEELRGRLLPLSLDNSQQPYFRPIFNQNGGSCGQASGISYLYTYEINCLRGTAANTTSTQYPSHYTYNFLNEGSSSNGSWYWDGFDIVKNGIPTVADYGGSQWALGSRGWLSGYEAYKNGFSQKVDEYLIIETNTPEGIETLKGWMYDHNQGNDETGGLAVFAAGASGYTLTTLPSGTPHAGMKVITEWGSEVNHAMTFVGYDDEIRYDYNNDGQYTNDLDINGDNIVNVQDWEIGGLILANSWGPYGFGNGGKSYMMYKLLADGHENSNSYGIWASKVHVVVPKETTPEIVGKINITETSRDKVNRIVVGYNTDLNASTPSTYETIFPFQRMGGAYYMQGGTSNADKTLELAVDFTDVLEPIALNEEIKLFVGVNVLAGGTGEIVDFSVFDYLDNGYETISEESNLNMPHPGFTWISTVINKGGTVGINDELRMTNYELKQNYPNPFNPVTKINYELAITDYESAEIVVYNTTGQMVWSSPITRYGSPVTGSILFDGSKFNSGIYYYSLIVDGMNVGTKSMVLIK